MYIVVSSNLLGSTTASASGNLQSPKWWSVITTFNPISFANLQGSKADIPQSTVKIKSIPFSFFNFLKASQFGPYPSLTLSGIYIIEFTFIKSKKFYINAEEDTPSTS